MDVGQVIIAVDVAGGSGSAAAAPAAVSVPEPAAPEPEPEPEPQGRQPVLVGYGVSEASTKRRPRKGDVVAAPVKVTPPALSPSRKPR